MSKYSANSSVVMPGLPDKRLKRPSSWAAAKVLKAQKSVASCIKGTDEGAVVSEAINLSNIFRHSVQAATDSVCSWLED